jgi:hypothetical protein
MRSAKSRADLLNPDAPPLAPHEERALIEANASTAPLLPDPATMTLGGSATRPWSVGAVNACLSQLLARTLPAVFHVEGEISNFRTYDRGHAFFTL